VTVSGSRMDCGVSPVWTCRSSASRAIATRTSARPVHETRKSLKRLRATVRLARDEAYRRENVAFRDAGRRLGGARDSQVLLETLDALTDRYRDAAPARALCALQADAGGPARRGSAPRSRGRRDRRGAGRAAPGAGWRLAARAGRPDALAAGFQRIYRRGRRAYRTASQEPSSENLHELRKRAQHLWYAAQIVRRPRRRR
jgi:CHAD domain-containing protein